MGGPAWAAWPWGKDSLSDKALQRRGNDSLPDTSSE